MTKGTAVAKKKTARASQPKAKTEIKQLVITLGRSNSEISKIEHLGSAGKRRAVSVAELAKLAGDDDMEDFCEALEVAYAAGLQDGLEEAIKDDPFAESGTAQHPKSAQESTGEQILKSGVRRTIFRRALRRGAVRQGAKEGHNGAQRAP